MSHAALTAVLPLRVGAQRKTSDLDRVERLLLPSFRRFWRGPEPLEFLVLVPPGDVDHVSARLALGGGFPMRVLSEDAVCPSLSGRLGWYKQQILKLAAARIVTTPWYLTLDADVMLRRTADELVRDGRAIFHAERATYHWEWWTASRAILRSSVKLDPETKVMGVTPEILHRETVLELLAEIGRRNDVAEVEQFLFEKKDTGWTEYSLYWLFVLERQLQDRLYRGDGPMSDMAWQPEHLASLPRRSAGDPSSGPLFFVLQSTLEIPIEQAERLMSGGWARAPAASAQPVASPLTAVLPLRVGAQKKTSDLDRVKRLLLPSFRRFWRGPEPLEFLVLVPPGDVDSVSARLGLGGDLPVRVLSEDVVCPSLSGCLGWHKQQVLKLAAARIVTTPWYLTLDADVMLRRTVSVDELVRDGRAIFHPKRAARHWDWWTASRTILRSDVPLGPDMEMMDVTPEILHRETVLELLAETGKRNDVLEVERFLFEKKDAGWTEYSLYWLFVLERQLQDRLYRKAGPLYEMAWRPEHLSSPTRQSDNDPSDRPPFFVLQSTLEIPIEEAERLMSADPPDAAATPPYRPASLLRRLFRREWRRSR